MVTSTRSGDYVEIAMRALKSGASVFSVGRSTTRLLVSHGITVTGEANSTSAELAEFIHRGPVLLLGAEVMRDELPRALMERGLTVTKISCYETVAAELNDLQREALMLADVVFVGAPSAWSVARDVVPASAWVVVPGTTTGEFVRADHERVLEGWDTSTLEALATLDT